MFDFRVENFSFCTICFRCMKIHLGHRAHRSATHRRTAAPVDQEARHRVDSRRVTKEVYSIVSGSKSFNAQCSRFYLLFLFSDIYEDLDDYSPVVSDYEDNNDDVATSSQNEKTSNYNLIDQILGQNSNKADEDEDNLVELGEDTNPDPIIGSYFVGTFKQNSIFH